MNTTEPEQHVLANEYDFSSKKHNHHKRFATTASSTIPKAATTRKHKARPHLNFDSSALGSYTSHHHHHHRSSQSSQPQSPLSPDEGFGVSHSSASSSASSTTSSGVMDERQLGNYTTSDDDDGFTNTPFHIPHFYRNSTASPSGSTNSAPVTNSVSALNRTLTQSVIRFDQLTTEFISLRNKLRTLIDDVAEQELSYESCVEQITQLRFERKFLREVVQLCDRKQIHSQSHCDDDESGANSGGGTGKRWSTPMGSSGLPLSSSNPSLPLTDRAANRRTVALYGSGAPTSSRESLFSTLTDRNGSRSSFGLQRTNSSDSQQRVTVDDLSSRRIQRAAFTMMLQTIRDTLLNANVGFPSNIDPLLADPTTVLEDSPLLSSSSLAGGLQNKHLGHSSQHLHRRTASSLSSSSQTSPYNSSPNLAANRTPQPSPVTTALTARITHLSTLIAILEPTVQELRDSIQDVQTGPIIAYRAWIREATLELEMLRVECEGLREAREETADVGRRSVLINPHPSAAAVAAFTSADDVQSLVRTMENSIERSNRALGGRQISFSAAVEEHRDQHDHHHHQHGDEDVDDPLTSQFDVMRLFAAAADDSFRQKALLDDAASVYFSCDEGDNE
ncbi:uncharacterized protein EV422DRAFT_150083 [Fimicolochytrium jonesii]|uniref:uncharacterized protein n=1 Tax=Fimicolochytrium jonesii TaxID=1396493 RepID=UPI0022FF3125|nr:uncharacterized protein EV422DRAFT_150083 [Fimicolochytrium jonesii]KAI8826018.1 hypothetical protein EV422DRAFT_150083 [Fimicolochytrium jonesii]